MNSISEPAWIDRFVTSMGNKGVRAEPEVIEMMARELYPMQSHLLPEDVAQAEWDIHPPHDD